SYLFAKCRYAVPTPTPAWRATSSRLASRPRSPNTSRAATRSSSRFRAASLRMASGYVNRGLGRVELRHAGAKDQSNDYAAHREDRRGHPEGDGETVQLRAGLQ